MPRNVLVEFQQDKETLAEGSVASRKQVAAKTQVVEKSKHRKHQCSQLHLDGSIGCHASNSSLTRHVDLMPAKALPNLSVCRGRRRGPKTSTCFLPRMDPHWDHHPQTTTQPQEGLPCRIHTSPQSSQAKLLCQTESTQQLLPETSNKNAGQHASLNKSEGSATRETSCP